MFKWLFLLIAYLPFQIALNPGAGFDLASLRVFILLLFIVWLVDVIARNVLLKQNIPWQSRVKSFPAGLLRFARNDIRSIGLLFFLILAGFSLIGAENLSWGLRKIIFFLSILPLYFLVTGLVDNWSRVKKVVLISIKASGLMALIGLLQFFGQFIFGLERVYAFWAVHITPVFSGFNLAALILAYPSWLVNVKGETILRAFSLFSDPHMFSFYLGLILPWLIVLLPQTRSFKQMKTGSLLAIYGFLLAALLLTFSRGAYLALIVTFLVLAGLLWQYLAAKKTALLLCLSLLIFIIPGTPIADRFYSSFDFGEGSNMGRLEMWQEAGQTGLGHIWQGVGLGNYSLMVDSVLGYRNPITAHNLYLDIFSEMGVFALIVWLVLILGTIGQLFWKVKNTRQEQRYLYLGLIGSLLYFSVHSFFETAIYSPIILALLMITLGLATFRP